MTPLPYCAAATPLASCALLPRRPPRPSRPPAALRRRLPRTIQPPSTSARHGPLSPPAAGCWLLRPAPPKLANLPVACGRLPLPQTSRPTPPPAAGFLTGSFPTLDATAGFARRGLRASHASLCPIIDPRGRARLRSSDRSPSSPRAGQARSWSTTVDGARGQRSNPSPHRRATERASAPCSPAAVDTCACAAVQGGRRSEPGASERIELGAERAPYPSHITSLLDSTRPDLTRLDSTHCRAAHTQRAQRPQHERARRGERSELSDLAEASRTPVACGLGWPRVTAG